ncbi:hypothetical protein KPL71_023924 [Citrus sinensis]|uniref:Uncharacterized protein n=1 Tax=Citrus sinensis TaxID=2711 RepID=A0ACB8ILW4_CITSI|nr:hypothetical protein KPL71_023924 [Citrus sinensis]
MDPLHCRASSFSSSSSGKTSDSKHVVSSEEFVIENFDKAIDCWELPKISKEKIYRTKKLDFWKNDYVIKTEERDITLSKPFETINLFSEKSLNKLKEKNFNYVHIGLIQIGIKPLTKEGLDTSILAVLRDGRFISFDDSLLSSIESSLCKGPISFDCYPNITLSLKDKNILKSMILQIKTHNYHMIEGSIPVALIFKISYKAMITAFSTQHKFQSKRDETLLLQIDLSRANTVIPKPIQWKDVNLPEEWILEGAAPPAIPKQLEPNTELQNVTQYSDGKVKLSFRRSNSSRFSDKASCSSIPSIEKKFSKIPSVINLSFQCQPRFSTSDLPSSSISSVDYTTKFIYFFSLVRNILFSKQHFLSFKESNPITIRKKTTEWKLFDSNRTVDSEHPPLRSITIEHGEPPVEIRASPYKIPKPNDPEINLSSIIQQNNFCNTNLNTIGKQLTRLENQFQQSTISVSPSPEPVSLKSDSDKKLKEPIFKPFQVSKTSQKLVQESKSDFAKAIREQLDRIEAASSSSSKIQIAPDTPQSSKIDTPQLSRIGVLDQDQVSIASSDLEAFTEEPIPKANKIHWELALPTSKSPPDLTIDNRPSALNQARYNASSVYEWNIDGMSEYNVLGVLQQMTMAANAYKTQSGTSDKAIAEILIAGFTGQLKGWWDHLLTKLQQLDILNAIQIDENGAPILDELNNPIQDAVATLILTISLHFIGDPSHLRDKNAELLHNLRCRKLNDFNDYKTTFFTRLFLRDDANHITWKEKFLAGLPTLLGEKVRNSIKALFNNRIPYDELTYGELVSFVNKEGLKICQDLKLQKRLKQELRQSKQELGGFCKQFNYDPFKTSTSRDCNGKCSLKPYKKHYKSKSHKKPFHDFRKLPYKKPSRPYKKHSFSKKKEFKVKPKTLFNFKEATCFKCGMKGHTARFCKMNKRLHELGLEEEILSKIAPLLVGSSDFESSWSGDNDPLQVDELFDSDSSASSNSDSDSDNSYLKKINVLTKDQEIFLELVKHISDPNLQKDYLDKLLKTMDSSNTEASSSKIPIVKKNSYDLTEILDKKKTKKSTPNIQDLQKEIKDIKLEIKDLKEKQKTDSATIQLLLQKQLQDTSDKEVESENDDVEQKVDNIESIPNDFLFVLKQITTRKYLIKITLIFSDDFAMDAIALFDTGADLNCIRKDIVPKRFHKKTNERLSAANNSKLRVDSKVEASIYNDKIEFKTSFVLTNDIHHAIILGTPFINLITPYAVNYDAILTKPKIEPRILSMDPLHCRASSFSSSSSGKTSDSKHVTDLSRANTVIPKPIQWKDVNLPEEWILEAAAPPAIPKQLEPNTKLQNVTQYSDGKVKLSFRRSNSSRFSDKASCSNIPSIERKFSKIPSVINLPFQCQPRFSTSDLPSSSISSVDYTTKVSKTSQKLVQESKSDFAKAIREQLDRIEAASSSSSKIQIAPDTPQSSKIDTPQLSRIGVLDQDQVSIASSDLEAFTEEPIPKANKIHWELALPTSKSPPDLTIDNRPSALNQARYNASSVYEWNIDGMSEYNVLGVLQQMTMAANAYKTQSGTSDKAIAEILIVGFTGQLKGWWDHLLTKLQQLDILNAIQIDENGAPILDELNNPIQDAVATLILTISLHFIGDPSHLRDKNAELLHNLRCRKLSDFNDYKTTFFTRLFLRDDANHISGGPLDTREKIPKQSSSFSSPRETVGSSSSSSSVESATEDLDREARSCSIALKYSSSVLALARRAWALDF